jgi:hypothetical protein
MMNNKQFFALVKKFGGWVEGDIARFPTVYQKQQFEQAYEEAMRND